MELKQYKENRLNYFDKWRSDGEHDVLSNDFLDYYAVCMLKEFIAQTIDELWALPAKRAVRNAIDFPGGHAKDEGWNACIAEAERMRYLTIKK